MKDLKEIKLNNIKNYILEAKNASSIINKIKKDFETELGDDVSLASGKSNRMQVYDIYCNKWSMDILQKINDILKKHLSPKFEGFTEDELKAKLKEMDENSKKYSDPRGYQGEFGRFDSQGLKNLDNPNYKYKIIY